MAQSSTLSTLSPKDFRTMNRLSEAMTYYHSLLRNTWQELYADTSSSAKTKPSQLIDLGLHFCRHLEMHHNIEEVEWFPVLARKMPGFQPSGFAKTQHKQIHSGLEKLEAYLRSCKSKEVDLSRVEVKGIMDSFGDVLWQHLDEEVVELGAENMSRYWTVEEMRRLPF